MPGVSSSDVTARAGLKRMVLANVETYTPAPVGLAPQKVCDLVGSDATRDTYQRKVLYDGSLFFVSYWESDDKNVYYRSSADGITWSDATVLWSFGVGPYYGANVDFCFGLSSVVNVHFCYTGSNGASTYWFPGTISGAVITLGSGGSLAGKNTTHGGTVAVNPDGNAYMVWHRNTVTNRVFAQRSVAITGSPQIDSITHGGVTSGGCVLVPYEVASPYHMLALVKDASNVLWWNLLNTANFDSACWDGISFESLVTLGSGFSDFCAASECSLGTAKVHLVYIKSTGELCYCVFSGGAWGAETVLEASGASYPAIAVGTTGKIYVLYVKDGKIKVRVFSNGWRVSTDLFTSSHTYSSPTYLSTSQIAQSGKIPVVWVEGTSPYELWFCYITE